MKQAAFILSKTVCKRWIVDIK